MASTTCMRWELEPGKCQQLKFVSITHQPHVQHGMEVAHGQDDWEQWGVKVHLLTEASIVGNVDTVGYWVKNTKHIDAHASSTHVGSMEVRHLRHTGAMCRYQKCEQRDTFFI